MPVDLLRARRLTAGQSISLMDLYVQDGGGEVSVNIPETDYDSYDELEEPPDVPPPGGRLRYRIPSETLSINIELRDCMFRRLLGAKSGAHSPHTGFFFRDPVPAEKEGSGTASWEVAFFKEFVGGEPVYETFEFDGTTTIRYSADAQGVVTKYDPSSVEIRIGGGGNGTVYTVEWDGPFEEVAEKYGSVQPPGPSRFITYSAINQSTEERQTLTLPITHGIIRGKAWSKIIR